MKDHDEESESLNGEKELAENMVLDFLCKNVDLEGQGMTLINQSIAAATMVKQRLRGKEARNSEANKLTSSLLGEFCERENYDTLERYLQSVYSFWEAYYDAKGSN